MNAKVWNFIYILIFSWEKSWPIIFFFMSELCPPFELCSFGNKIWKSCVQDISISILGRAFIFSILFGMEKKITWLTFEYFPSNFDRIMELWNCNSSFKCASVITVSPQVCYSLFAYMIFIKNNEINESHELCHVRGKQTVGGIVFY